jgi:uncharacterized membrane protein
VFRITAVSRGNRLVSSSVNGTILALQVYGLALECDSSPLLSGPGFEAVFHVNLTNDGNGRDMVALALEGKWAACATMGAHNMSLGPWETALLLVRLAVPGNATAGSELALCLSARSSGGETERLALEAVVDRVRGARLEATQTHRTVRPGGTARFDILLGSTGNGDEQFTLSSEAPKDWVISHDTAVPLGPYAETRLPVDAALPSNITGGEHTFLLRASVAGGGLADLNLTVDVIMPDIFIGNMRASPELFDEGGATTLSFTVGNIGTDNASAVTVTLYDNGKKEKFWDLGRLVPGYQEDITLKLHPGRGNHMLSVVASTPDRELSAANNEAQVEAHVRSSASFIPGFGAVLLAAAALCSFLGGRRRGQNR